MKRHEFTTVVKGRGPNNAWAWIVIPPDVRESLGGKGRYPVRGTVNGFAFRSSIMSYDGTYYVMCNKEMRSGANAGIGAQVQVVLERDNEPRGIETPEDLALALEGDATAKAIYDKLAYSHKKEYVDWIMSAKQPATRERRVAQALVKLVERRTLKD